MTLSLPVPSGIFSLFQHDRGGAGRAQLVPSICWNLIPRPAGPHGFFSNSDDHLLKNIELFDKLSLRFNGRVLFIKDVIGDEICCWSFYGQGRKLAEVCCTSIVYATEKKQTKVWGASLWVGWGRTHTSETPTEPLTTVSKRGIHFAIFLKRALIVLGKDEGQYKGLREWHRNYLF